MHSHDALEASPLNQRDLSHTSTERPIRLRRTRKVIRFMLAIDAWKRSGKNLGHRMSFPLLRQVFRNERKAMAESPSLAEFATESLQKSAVMHGIIFVAMTPVACWSLFCVIRGLAAWFRFGIFTNWMALGPPLLIYSAVRAFVSYKSRQAQLNEVNGRSVPPRVTKK